MKTQKIFWKIKNLDCQKLEQVIRPSPTQQFKKKDINFYPVSENLETAFHTILYHGKKVCIKIL